MIAEFLKALIGNLGATLNALTPKITVPFAAAAWILLYTHTRGWFPLPPSVVISAFVAGVLCTCLAVTGVALLLWTSTHNIRERVLHRLFQRRERRRVEAELPFLTPKEREILAYLLAKKQKMFEVLPDGEQAATLIAKGFVVYPARRPVALHRDIAVMVPDHIWQILLKHQAEFSYDPPNPEIHPWRTHWMAR